MIHFISEGLCLFTNDDMGHLLFYVIFSCSRLICRLFPFVLILYSVFP